MARAAATAAQAQILALLRSRGHATEAMRVFMETARPSQARCDDARVAWCLQRACRPRIAALEQVELSRDDRAQIAVLAAKTAHAVIKLYEGGAGGGAKEKQPADADARSADALTAMDLAAMALSVLCRLESELRLGELVLENMLFQVAKTYADMPASGDAVIWLVAALQLRLWEQHRALGCKDAASSYRAMLLDTQTQRLQLEDLCELCGLPAPSDAHGLAFARLVISTANLSVNLLLAKNSYKDILCISENTLSRWIEHLRGMHAVDTSLAASYANRMYRVLWKCAASVDSNPSSDAVEALRLYLASIAYLLKCSNSSIGSVFQQIYRIGVQFEKRQASKPERMVSLLQFYAQVGELVIQQHPKFSAWSWESVLWLDHYVRVCESSRRLVDSLLVMQQCMLVASACVREDSSVHASLSVLFAAVALELISGTHSTSVTKALFEKQARSNAFLGRGYSTRVRDLAIAISTEKYDMGLKTICDAAIKAMNEANGSKVATAQSLPVVLRNYRKAGTKFYNVLVNGNGSTVVHETVKDAVIDCVVAMCASLTKCGQGRMEISRELVQTLVSTEARLCRIVVAIASRRIRDDNVKWFVALDHHVLQVQRIVDNAVNVEYLSADVLADAQAIVKDCYGLATTLYRRDDRAQLLRFLLSTVDLACSCLGFVMHPKRTHPASTTLVDLPVEQMTSLLVSCLRDQGDIGKAQRYAILCVPFAKDPVTFVCSSHICRLVTLTVDYIETGADAGSVVKTVCTMLEETQKMWRRRDVSDSVFCSLLRQIDRCVDEATSATVCKMRKIRPLSEIEKARSLQAALRGCALMKRELWSRLLPMQSSECVSAGSELTGIATALTDRVLAFGEFYETGDTERAVTSLGSVHRMLTDAINRLSSPQSAVTSTDIGCAFGWRGVVAIEMLQMRSVDALKDESVIETEALALEDIRQCTVRLASPQSRPEACTGVLFDSGAAARCLDIVCASLSLLSAPLLEAKAREILCNLQANEHDDFAALGAPLHLLRIEETTMSEPNRLEWKETVMEDANQVRLADQLNLVDAEAGLCLSSILSKDLTQARLHLANANEYLGVCHTTSRGTQDAMIYKGIGMREILLFATASDLHFYEGAIADATASAKSALAICWKLSVKFGYAARDVTDQCHTLPEAIKSALFKYDGASRPAVCFRAIECSSWDLLAVTKLLLCRLAALALDVNNPHQASMYYTEAMELVGGLHTGIFRRRPFFEFAQLQVLAERTSHAAAVLQLLSNEEEGGLGECMPSEHARPADEDANPSALLQHCDELIQQGDVCVLELQTQSAETNYSNVITLLQSRERATHGLSAAYAHAWRKLVKLKLRDLDTRNEEQVDDFLRCMKQLKRACKQCRDIVEDMWCTCQLAQGSLVLLRSASSKAFMPVDRIVQMMSTAYSRGNQLQIAHLSRELRLTMGLASLMATDVFPSAHVAREEDGESEEWSTFRCLANCCTIEPAAQDFSHVEGMEIENPSNVDITTSHQSISTNLTCAQGSVMTAYPSVAIVVGLSSELSISIHTGNLATPMTYWVGKVNWEDCMTEIHAVINASRDTLSGHSAEEASDWNVQQKKTWWGQRKELDDRLGSAVHHMEAQLGFWRCLLHVVPLADVHRTTAALCDTICASRSSGLSRKSEHLVSSLLHCYSLLTTAEIKQCIHHVAGYEGLTLSSQEIDLIVENVCKPHDASSDDCHSDSSLLSVSKESLTKRSVRDLQDLLSDHGGEVNGSKSELIERILRLRDRTVMRQLPRGKRKAESDALHAERQSIVLILDHRLECFPWECMDVLQASAVTRMPSLDLMVKNSKLHDAALSPTKPGVSVDNKRVAFLLNPAGDLMCTEKHLSPVLRRGQEVFAWRGVIGRIPEEDAFRDMLLDSDVFVYCGHGSGEKYFRREQIRKLPPGQCSAALLFGCSSGKLEREGVFGPHGAVISYLRAGSPAVLAMLWDVTDKDVDLMSVYLIEQWLQQHPDDDSTSASNAKPLAAALQEARQLCKLRYLNGAAAVCYGLPLFVKQVDQNSPSESKKARV